MTMLENKKKIAKYLAIPVAVFSVSTAAIFIKLSKSHPVAISFYRMLFSFLIFSFPFIGKIKEFLALKKRELFLASSAGFLLAFHFAFWIYSLELTTVTSSVVLVSSHPLLVMFISDNLLGESISKKAYFSVLIALVGVSVIFLGDLTIQGWSAWGDVLALMGMMLLAAYLTVGRTVRKSVSTVSYVFIAYGVASLVLAIVSFFVGTSFKIYPVREYAIFISLAVLPTFFGHTVYNWSLKHVRADLVSISLLGEPIISSFLAFILLIEVPPHLTILGAIITLIGIYLSLKWR